jgi:LmbE family N-acetylglucosaminyl deacetylase
MGNPLPDHGEEMSLRNILVVVAFCVLFLGVRLEAQSINLEGGPGDSGYNVGSVATFRATLTGVSADVTRYAVFAEIQYMGTTAVSTAQLDRKGEGKSGEVFFEGGWPIPRDAPTGIYSLTLRVEDRTTHRLVARKQVRGFGAYRKLVRIARLTIDKTFYSVGEPIYCEVVLDNLTDRELSGLRVEFSNPNYPWIALFSAEGGDEAENPDLAITVMREGLNLPPRGRVAIPMMPAGTATFLQGTQQAVLGAGGPARQEEIPFPEVDQYTVAVWNAHRTFLYDMQFTKPAIVRAPGRDKPIPYGRNFTHAYNSDIDFVNYREFYEPGELSAAIRIDRSRSMFRPGDRLTVKAALKNVEGEAWSGVNLRARVLEAGGKELHAATLESAFDLAPGQTRQVEAEAWEIPSSAAPGTYKLDLALMGRDGRSVAATTTEIAVNPLPASLLLFFAHEDDEQAYIGLIRAAVEAGIPIRVGIYTGGDVGACERYYSKPCGPNEAREFGIVRMEETAEVLEHVGLARENLIYLGLPDGGSGAIWSENIKASNPFLSIYLATDHAPYENTLKPNLPYAREPVIELTKKIIRDFRPAMIATTHPDERHVDHRTANWFAMKACHELLREEEIDPSMVVLADQAYGAGGFKPAPYQYEPYTVFLSGEVAALKQEVTWIYQSQDGNLAEGRRKPLRELPREEPHLRIVDWQEHEGWNE